MYLGSCDDLHALHHPAEGGGHLVEDAVLQELLGPVKQQASPHHQDGAVHLPLGLVRCWAQTKYTQNLTFPYQNIQHWKPLLRIHNLPSLHNRIMNIMSNNVLSISYVYYLVCYLVFMVEQNKILY